MFRLTNGKLVSLAKVSNDVLDHEINLIERRAERWAKIFNTSQVKYLTPRYAPLVLERILR